MLRVYSIIITNNMESYNMCNSRRLDILYVIMLRQVLYTHTHTTDNVQFRCSEGCPRRGKS